MRKDGAFVESTDLSFFADFVAGMIRIRWSNGVLEKWSNGFSTNTPALLMVN
jgi:hypothetical protein